MHRKHTGRGIAALGLCALLCCAAEANAQSRWALAAPGSPTRLYVFVTSNGRLWLDYWNGSTWKWYEAGKPSPLINVESVPAVAKFEYPGGWGLFAFVRNSDNHLWAFRFYANIGWAWEDRSAPYGANDTFVGNPGASAWSMRSGLDYYSEWNAAFIPKNYVAAWIRRADDDGVLSLSLQMGGPSTPPDWADFDAPNAASIVSDPVGAGPSAVVTTNDGNVYAVTRGLPGPASDPNDVFYDQWERAWSNMQRLPAAVDAVGSPAVAINQHASLFVMGENGHLYRTITRFRPSIFPQYSTGFTDHGATASTLPMPIGADGFGDTSNDGNAWVFVARPQANGGLMHATGSAKDDFDAGTPAPWPSVQDGVPAGVTAFSGAPSVVAFKDPATNAERVYAFIVATNGHLYVRYRTSGAFVWADQGVIPTAPSPSVPKL